MWYSYLADVVVGTHVLYVGYVVLGQLAIFAGILLRWGWVRNPWFRWTQLLMMLIVAFEAVCGITCPLTAWEDNLRQLAGEHVDQGSFMGRLMHDVMFYTAPEWVFTVCYILFSLLVLATFVFAPPRRRRKEGLPAESAQPGRWFTRGFFRATQSVAGQPQQGATSAGEPKV
jgi:polyferredoxin